MLEVRVMRLSADREILKDVLGRALRGVGSKSSFPALTGILIEVDDGGNARFTGTDYDVTVVTEVTLDDATAGVVLAPGGLLTKAVGQMPRGKVMLEAVTSEGADSPNSLTVSGEAPVEGHMGPEFSLSLLNVDDYPKIEDIEGGVSVEVDGAELLDAIGQVEVAASTDQARPILTGVLIENITADDGKGKGKGKKKATGVRLVATDSYRLAVLDLPGVGLDLASPALLPAMGLRQLRPAIAAEKVTVETTDRETQFTSERGLVRLRQIEGTFPRYRTLLPDESPVVATVNRGDLLDAIQRVRLVAEEHIPARLEFYPDKLRVSATRQGVGGETEELAAKTVGSVVPDSDDNDDDGGKGKKKDDDGLVLSIAFNPMYLSDGVRAISPDDADIQISMMDGFKPAVITSEESTFLYLLMPVRT